MNNKEINQLAFSGMQTPKSANRIMTGIMWLLTFFCITPLLLVLAISFSDNGSVEQFGYSLIPHQFSLGAYAYIFRNGDSIFKAYLITIILTIIGSIVSLAIISMYAYPLSRKTFKYRKIFTLLAVFTMLFNAGLVPFYMVYVNILHIKNTPLALILPFFMQALYVLIMRTFYMTTIPDALIDSAKIDGASEFKTFLKIVIPLSKPSLATIGLFNVLAIWNDWYFPLLFIEDKNLYTLQYLLYKIENKMQFLMQNSSSIDASAVTQDLPTQTARMAMAIVAIGPIVFAYPFFQKYFVKGITIGAIKG